MKYYRFKESSHTIDYNPKTKESFLTEDMWGDSIPRFRTKLIKSKEELIQALTKELKSDYKKNYKSLVEDIIREIGIEEYEVEYKDIPCIIVRCNRLLDDYESDASRFPTLYLKSAKELPDLNLKYEYEVYLILKSGKLKLSKEYSTYTEDF